MGKRAPPEVLIVEDQSMTRMAAADAISDTGLHVREAGDADEALQAMDAYPDIGVLFTDIQMPGQINGLELAKQVHKDRPDVELIVTSGEIKVKDSELPDHGTFLSKPYHTSRLIEVVEKKVASRSGKSDSLSS